MIASVNLKIKLKSNSDKDESVNDNKKEEAIVRYIDAQSMDPFSLNLFVNKDL